MSMFACNYKKMKAEKLSVIDLFNTGYTHFFPLPHFLDSFSTEYYHIFCYLIFLTRLSLNPIKFFRYLIFLTRLSSNQIIFFQPHIICLVLVYQLNSSNQFNSLTGFLKRIGIIEASQHKFMSSIHSTFRLPPERYA